MSRRKFPVLLIPALVFQIVFFLIPVADILIRSVRTPSGFTTEFYETVLMTPLYGDVLRNTFSVGLTTTVVTLILGYPLAYAFVFGGRLTRNILTFAILLPFLTSLLVRTYAWMLILSPTGIVAKTIERVGFEPSQMLYNRFGVIVGMVYILLPYMVLTLSSVMGNIDRNVLTASYTLGASGFATFWRVFWPLSLPGVATASLLVFVLSLGYFMTPKLMGGHSDTMIAMSIDTQVEHALNWHLASALSVVLLVVTFGILLIYARLVGLGKLLEGR